MSASSHRITPLEVRESAMCMCASGGSCSSFAPGHAVHLIQARLASATPSEWVDAIVETVQVEDGTLTLRTLIDAQSITVWNGAGAAGALNVGSPVALHGRYHVLADGSRRFNVLRSA